MSRTSELLKQKKKEREQTAPLTEQTVATGGGTPAGGNRTQQILYGQSSGSRTRKIMAEKMLTQGVDGYNSWLTGVSDLSKRLSDDYTARQGTYQSATDFKKYRDQNAAAIGDYQYQAGIYRDYFNENASLFDEEAVKNAQEALTQYGDYLSAVRRDLDNEQAFWNQFEDEAAYTSFLEQQERNAKLSTFDLEDGRNSLTEKEAQLDEAKKAKNAAGTVLSGVQRYGSQAQREEAQAALDEATAAYEAIQAEVTALERDIYDAEILQKGLSYSGLLSAADFGQYSDQGAAIENPAFWDVEKGVTIFGRKFGGEKPGNIVTYSRDNWENIALGETNNSQMTGRSLYHYMTDDEVSIYNYLLAKEGADAAQEYLDYLEETLNYRFGTAQGENIRGIENGFGRTLATGLYGFGAGLDQWVSGTRQLFSKDRLPTTATQYGSAYIREDLADSGPQIAGGSLGQMAYEATNVIGNMAPSILVAAMTGGAGASATARKIAGAVTMGGSSAGNAYSQKLAEGYNAEKAGTYAALVGASEAGLQYLLGGISAMGGVTDDILLAKVASIDNALARVALTGSIKIGSEITEEELQLWLEPAFESLIFGTEYDAPTFEDMAYTAIVTALSTGLLESGNIAAAGFNPTAPATGPQSVTEAPEAAGLVSATQDSDVAGQLIAAGATEEQARQLAPIIQGILTGDEISGNQAGAIAKNEAAVSVLEAVTGEAINTDAPLGEVKTTIRSLASRQNAQVEPVAAEDTPAQVQSVETVETAPAAPTMEAVTQNNVQAVADFAKTMEKAGAAAMTQMYDGSQSAEQYVAGMMRAYNAGKNGTSRAEIINDLQGITGPQAQAAYIAGQADAQNGGTAVARTAEPRYTNLDNNLEGASESDGKTAVYLRNGSQRAGSSYPGGQVSAVEGGAGQNTLRTIQGRPADGEAARLSYGEKVSTASLGIGGGSTKASIRLVTGGETASTKAAKQLAKERGMRLVLFAGDNLSIRQADGTVASVRGMYVSGDRVFVRADHPRYTADQLMRHEAGHDAVAKGEVDIEAVKGRLAELYGEDYAENIAKMYEQAYRGSGISAEGVWEECICDSLGDMNVFDDTEAAKIAEEFLPRVKQAAQDVRGKNGTTRAPPSASEARTSRETKYWRPNLTSAEWGLPSAKRGSTATGHDGVSSVQRRSDGRGGAERGTQTGGTEVKAKFSMESPVEQTQTLVALHNMDEEKIRRTLELGAWPSPSIAIVQATQGHTSYGEYSAIFPRSVIDPELDERNKVYGSDAWTPTHSNVTVEREVNQQEKRVFEKTIEDLSNTVAGGAFTGGGALGRAGVNDSTSKSVRDIAEQISRYPDVMAAYLALQEGDVEVKYKDKDYHRFGSNALRRYIASMSAQELAALDVAVETRDNAAIEAETPRVRQVLEEVFREEIAQRRGKNGEPIPEKLAEVMLKRRMESVQGYQIESFIQSAWQMLQDGSDTTDIDKHAMMEELESKVDKRAVAAWAEEMLSGVLGESGIYNGEDIYTENGRKSFQETHMPLTAENIVKAMYSTAASRGEGAYGMAAGGLQSVASPSYQTVEEIRADSHRLGRVLDEELEARKNEIDELLAGFYEELNELPGANIYNIPGAVVNAASERYIDDVIRSFEQDGIRGMSADTALRLIEVFEMAAQLPTEYFEAKPRRVVEFNEAAAVLAPSDAPADLISEMEDKGMNVLTYEAGNDQQRLELLNSLEGVKFSRELDSEGRQLTEGQADYFAESKSVDAQGRLKVMYRGGSGDFTVFDRRKSSYSNLYGRGFYFTDSKTHAEQYGNARAFYLNITNPVPTDKRTITRAQMLTFLEAVAENEDDYSFENYGYGATPQSVLRSVFSGKSDFAMLYDVSQTAIGDMVAAVELFNDVNGTDFDGLILDTETVTFRSEQAKSVTNENPTSDPDIRYSRELDAIKAEYRDKTDHLYLHEKTDGTISLDNMVVKKAYRDQGVGTQILRDIIAYADATGKTITLTPTSEFGTKARLTKWYKEHGFVENKGRNADYRLSDTMYRLPRSKYSRELENVELLREQNEALREKAEYWKGQTRRTTAENRTVRQADVDKLARQLIKSYGSLLETKDVSGQLKELGDFMVRGGDGKNELTWREMKDRAVVIAKDIIDSAEQLNDEMYQRYSDLRSYLRKTNIIYGKEYHGDIPDFGDFRKRNFGRLNLKTNGRTNLDSVYEEMSEMWPEFFDSAEQTHPTDQLLHIIDVLDSLRPVYENPFSYDMATAVEYVANDIIDGLLGEDVRQTPPTFADRQAAKLDSQKAKDRQKLDRLRAQKNERIAEIRKQGQERTREALRKVRADRDAKIKDIKARYREKDAKARESRRATALRAKIQRHVKELSSTLLRPSDKHHVPEALRGPVARLLEAINLEDNYELEFGRDAKYHRVKPGDSLYAEVTKRTQAFAELRKAYAEIAGELVIDPDLLGDNGAPGLFDEVAALADKPIAAMNTTELETIWQTIRAVEASIRSANKMFTAARFQTVSEAAEALRRDNDSKKAKTEYNYIGGLQKLVGVDMLTPEAFLHRLGDSGDAIFRMMRSAQDEHIRIMKAVADFTHEALSDVNVRTLEKELHTVTLGGEEVKLSTAQLMELYALMRREQAQAHILAGGILPDVVSTKGLKKITKAEPIRGVTLEEVSKALSLLTAEQTAIAEKLQDYASTTLSDFGNKASMAVYNYKKFTEEHYWPIRSNRQETKSTVEKDTAITSVANRGFTKATKPNANTSVKLGSIFDTFSTHASEMATYAAWLGTTEDVNRIRNFTFRDGEGNRTGTVKGIFDRVHGSQGSAYLQKLLSDIANGVKGTHGETEYMGGLVGNYKAASVGANLRVIIQQPTAILRALDMIAPQYLAAGIRPGGWKKALRYAPIAQWKDWGYFDINTGRQMKDVLFDSDSKLEKVKQASMWMAGKMDSLAWGQLWNAVETETKAKHKELKPGTREFYDAVAARFTEIIDRTQVVDGILQRSQIMRSGSGLTKMATAFMGEPTKQYNMLLTSAYDASYATSKERRTAAKKRLARTVFALSVSSVVNAAAQSIMDAVRDDDKEKDYWDKWLSAFTGFTGEEEGFGEHLAAFWSGNLESIINPAQYIPYAKDVVSILQGYDVSRMDMESIEKTISAAQNMLKALNGEGKYTLAGASANLFAEGARLLGIPVANFKREVKSFAMLAAIESDNYVMQYYMEKTSLSMNYSGNSGTFMDILYNAFVNDREAYELIYADMVESGFDPEKIKSGMETRMKADQGVTKAEELDSRYLSPEQQTQYDRTMRTIRGSSIWDDATAEQQDKVEGYLYDLIMGNSDGAKMQEKIDGGAEYGIDETDYLLYKLALSMVDEPTESGKYGSYTNDEVEAAIKMLGLDDEASGYLRG